MDEALSTWKEIVIDEKARRAEKAAKNKFEVAVKAIDSAKVALKESWQAYKSAVTACGAGGVRQGQPAQVVRHRRAC